MNFLEITGLTTIGLIVLKIVYKVCIKHIERNTLKNTLGKLALLTTTQWRDMDIQVNARSAGTEFVANEKNKTSTI